MSDLEIGETLSSTLRVTLQSLVRLTLIGILISLPCGVIFALVIQAHYGGFDFGPSTAEDPTFLILVYALGIPGWTVFNSVVIRDSYARLCRRPLTFGQAIGEGIRSTPRLFVLALLLFGVYILSIIPVGILAGLSAGIARQSSLVSALVVIVGMIMFMVLLMTAVCVWYPILPVALLEKRIGSSFGRSAQLTKGNRFMILALILILGMIGMGVYLLFAIIVGLGSALVQGLGVGTAVLTVLAVIAGVAYFAFVVAMTSLQMILPTSVYYQLKVKKEGGDQDQLAEVFG